MHELSIAVNLVDIVSKQATENDAIRVKNVCLRLGPLSGVVPDALRFSFEVATTNTVLEGAQLEIDEVPVVVYCPSCEAEKTLTEFVGFRCPDCGGIAADVRQGKELEILSFEIETP
ncbi:MAG: hydrogenase maturation nickel metallochaperone HypA [Bacteroidetes bacterium]|nr:hydrogenase maturation nickel metallochaperone HypA [Bacteroidota bacterium]